MIIALFALIFPIAFSAGRPLAAPERESEKSSEPPVIPEPAVAEPEQPANHDAETMIKLKTGGEVIDISMRDYLIGVVGAEMPASFEPDALMAQAVAARTYTLYKMEVEPSSNHPEADVCGDSKCCKAYKDTDELKAKWGDDYGVNIEKITDAVTTTDGEYLTYDSLPILAVFHSSSNGKTEAPENVWGSPVPYLVPVDSMEDGEKVPNYISTVTVSSSSFKDTVRSSHPGADFSEQDWIADPVYSDSGRLLTVKLGGVTVTGTELRRLFDLRSTDIKLRRTDDGVSFTVTGYGHGVGMSQYGANAMAESGKTYREILAWYYPGTALSSE
ncbi:MAG: stage II sporulation protein D [Oscillospiraceae bacterium]|nr:stage II sporulation protein D [Oscillospiraceae bacterium]